MSSTENEPSSTQDPRWDALVENFKALDQQPGPHEPSAEERAASLHKLFTTGPVAEGPRDHVAEDEPENFVPEEPAALGSGDPMLNLAWACGVGGPLGLLLCVIFFRNAPGFVYLGLAAAALLGVIYLFRRLPTERDPGDDGAKV